MALLSVIRRWALRDQLSIREIARRTGLSRNTIRKYLRAGTVEPAFQTPKRLSKLDPFADKLSAWLKTSSRARRAICARSSTASAWCAAPRCIPSSAPAPPRSCSRCSPASPSSSRSSAAARSPSPSHPSAQPHPLVQRAVDYLHGCQPLIDEEDEAAA
jgi:predicted DNA-binding transcriptional regulator AlpA